MTMTEAKPFRVGDEVVFDADSARRFPGVWKVAKINPRTIKVTQEATHRSVNSDPIFLLHRADAPNTTVLPSGATVTEMPIPDYFDIGQIVRVRGKDGLFVVIKYADKINVTKLGGDAGRYWRCVPQLLTKVSLAEAAEELVANL